jgi:hypothetical protein
MLNVFQQYEDYAMRVLLPEIIIKIVMDCRRLEHDEAERFISEEW